MIKIGVSSCLLGEKVRWDAQHKRNEYLTKLLGQFVQWVPVCPELEVGMGVPRETVRLVNDSGQVRMLGTKSQTDWTDKMLPYAQKKTKQLAKEDLSAYIFKKDSPSCGVFRVKIYPKAGGVPQKDGAGLFAKMFKEANPLLPIEEEGRLSDAQLRENFIERVFVFARLQDLLKQRFSRGRFVQFHSEHKYQLMAHSPKHYRELGRMVAHIKDYSPKEFVHTYSQEFMAAFEKLCTRKRHRNVLEHIYGYFKDEIDTQERQDIVAQIHAYSDGYTPLIVPVTLIRHYVHKFKVAYIQQQHYLNPHPQELMLRNHV